MLTTFTVINLTDGAVAATGDLPGSLRQAIYDANNTVGADTIEFDNAIAGGLLRLTEGQLTISDEVILVGSGSGITITADANGDDILVAGTNITDVAATLASGATLLDDNSRVLRIIGASSATTINGLTLTGGRTTGSSGQGGGVRSDALLTFNNSTVSGNSTANKSAYGGGIYGDISITLTNSTVSGNSTTGNYAQGGGIFGDGAITLTGSTVTGNSTTGNYAGGGGIYADTTLTLTNSMVTGNVTVNVNGDQTIGVLTRQGGTIVGGTLRDDTTLIQTGLSAADIFASTTEVIDGDGNPTGVYAGVLADNGGLTATVAILSGGAAHDTGDATEGTQPDFDQRGNPFARIAGAALDIGAYEAQTFAFVVDTDVDESDGDYSTGDLSLREALEITNANPGADTITFDASLTGSKIESDTRSA